MSAVPAAEPTELTRVLRSIRRPRPILDRERERSLTTRQKDILDELQEIFFREGFADLTMTALAPRLNCSLRTLYALAPSRDDLVLMVVDRNLWRVGQSARVAIDPAVSPLDAVRRYHEAALFAVSEWTEPFTRDLAAVPEAQALATGHRNYLFKVTSALLDLAVERGEIVVVDTTAVARLLAGLGGLFSQPDIIRTLRSSPKDAAEEVLEVVLRGLRVSPT